eukprot:1241346-Amphidinium_carterae.1
MKALRADRAVVLAVVQNCGIALLCATEADRHVMHSEGWRSSSHGSSRSRCSQRKPRGAIPPAQAHHQDMLSGCSTVVVAQLFQRVGDVLAVCRRRLCLHDEGLTWPSAFVRDWPGFQPLGEILELVVTR